MNLHEYSTDCDSWMFLTIKTLLRYLPVSYLPCSFPADRQNNTLTRTNHCRSNISILKYTKASMGKSWSREEDAYLTFLMEYNGGHYIPTVPKYANSWIDVSNLMHDHYYLAGRQPPREYTPMNVQDRWIKDIWPRLFADTLARGNGMPCVGGEST